MKRNAASGLFYDAVDSLSGIPGIGGLYLDFPTSLSSLLRICNFCSAVESSEYPPNVVTPAEAGVQNIMKRLDSCFRRNDDSLSYKSNSKLSYSLFSLTGRPTSFSVHPVAALFPDR
jgi:hypothetical protein